MTRQFVGEQKGVITFASVTCREIDGVFSDAGLPVLWSRFCEDPASLLASCDVWMEWCVFII